MKDMHTVSDDNFDKLFQDKLYSYEVEPTDAVWTGISQHLNDTHSTRSFPILRLAAASLAGIVGLGIWLAATNEPMKLTGSAPLTEEKEKSVQDHVPATSASTAQIAGLVQRQKRVEKIVQPRLTPIVEAIETKPDQVTESTVAQVEAASVETRLEVQEPLSLENNNTLIGANNKPVELHTAPVLAMTNISPRELEAEDSSQKVKKINSVGSFVNFVVSKVDKRKNKIIEFEDGDEGTMVSSVNLLLLKYKAKE